MLAVDCCFLSCKCPRQVKLNHYQNSNMVCKFLLSSLSFCKQFYAWISLLQICCGIKRWFAVQNIYFSHSSGKAWSIVKNPFWQVKALPPSLPCSSRHHRSTVLKNGKYVSADASQLLKSYQEQCLTFRGY